MPHKLFVALDRFSPNGSHQRELLDGIHGDLVGQIKPTIRTPFFGLEVGRSPSEADDRQRDSTRQIGPYRPQRRLLPCCSERIAEWWSALRVSGVNASAKIKLPTTSARSYPSQFNSVIRYFGIVDGDKASFPIQGVISARRIIVEVAQFVGRLSSPLLRLLSFSSRGFCLFHHANGFRSRPRQLLRALIDSSLQHFHQEFQLFFRVGSDLHFPIERCSILFFTPKEAEL